MRFTYDASIDLTALEILSPEQWQKRTKELLRSNCRLLSIFALPADSQDLEEKKSLCSILAQDDSAILHILRSNLLSEYQSFSLDFPQAQLFERDLFEQSGVRVLGHPKLQPVRFNKPYPLSENPSQRAIPGKIDVFSATESDLQQIGIGPVILTNQESAHFRFQCFGETVINCEICLGFEYRGLEYLLAQVPPRRRIALVECIAGKIGLAHAFAHCLALERLAGVHIPQRARLMRRIALELERIVNHLNIFASIASICNCLAIYNELKKILDNLARIFVCICGSRFGRNLICPGGVRYIPDNDLCLHLLKCLKVILSVASNLIENFLNKNQILEYLQERGKLDSEIARQFACVGVIARACGLPLDARFSSPLSSDPQTTNTPILEYGGDILARLLVRQREILASKLQIETDLHLLAEISEDSSLRANLPEHLPPLHLSVGQVESSFGELSHIVLNDALGHPAFFKIIDPSFHNWQALAFAMRGAKIEDFMINYASFGLSAAGHDL